MKPNLIHATFIGVALISSTSAFGQQEPQTKGFYLEGSIGRSDFDLKDPINWTVEDKDTSWSGVIGYDFTENLALEGGYRSLGKATAAAAGAFNGTLYGRSLVGTGSLSLSADAKGWTLGPRVNVPLNDKFSLFGRAGIFNWETEAKVAISAAYTWGGTAYAGNASASKTYTGTDGYWGFGANYQATPLVGVGVGFTEFKFGGDIDHKVRSLDLNLKFKF